MADIGDDANDAAEFFMSVAQRDRLRLAPKLPATGYCLACGAPLPDDRRWCDATCRDDWQKTNEMQNRR